MPDLPKKLRFLSDDEQELLPLEFYALQCLKSIAIGSLTEFGIQSFRRSWKLFRIWILDMNGRVFLAWASIGPKKPSNNEIEFRKLTFFINFYHSKNLSLRSLKERPADVSVEFMGLSSVWSLNVYRTLLATSKLLEAFGRKTVAKIHNVGLTCRDAYAVPSSVKLVGVLEFH